jgi:RNA polymerase sigma-70 factor (ECF subfamily)
MSPDSGEPPAPATDKAQQRPLSAIHGGLSSTELDELLVNTFNAMKDELISTLNLLLRSRDDAIDMAQEAFLRCWKAKEACFTTEPTLLQVGASQVACHFPE